MDLTGLIAPAVPDAYKKGTLDIKNPKQEWFPDFGTGKDRVEFRLYDAPTNEYLAALQIKYHRALLNKALNSKEPVPYEAKYASNAKESWRADAKAYIEAAEAHLKDLGLDVQEFRPLILEAWETQQAAPAAPRELQRYEDWLAPKKPARTAEPRGSKSSRKVRPKAQK
jgi:hypothetical protein